MPNRLFMGLTERLRTITAWRNGYCHLLPIAVPILQNIEFGLMTVREMSAFLLSDKQILSIYSNALQNRRESFSGFGPGRIEGRASASLAVPSKTDTL